MCERVDLWRRDPVECVRELIGNPAFREAMAYTPEKLYDDEHMESRIFHEMHNGDWWWQTQVSDFTGRLPDDATIAPVILASDKTKLSQFHGDQTAWPVYLSIGNIAKATRRQVSARATILLGYIPATKLECFKKKSRSDAGYRLFHHCMKNIMEALIEAGKKGVLMTCADGCIRRIFPILAAYIADHPEQCLIVNVKENHCPKGRVTPKQRGDPDECLLRSVDETLELLSRHADGEDDPKFKTLGLRPVYEPFWKDLPHCNIYEAMTPDILHQLHKGVFKTHLVSWCTKILGDDELDRRFKAMPDLVGLRHFKKGISSVSQWTGAEHKEMQKVFLGLLVGAVSEEVLIVAKALIDFIYYAQFQLHTSKTLRGLEEALHIFHQHKTVFVSLGIRKHFNIPRIHSMLHYLASIRLFGSLDGYNTELSERLHIDFAKHAYLAGNHKDFIAQMTVWLRRHEAMDLRSAFLEWLAKREKAAQAEIAIRRLTVQQVDSSMASSPPASLRLAKRCHWPHRTLSQLQDQHGATCFLLALRRYVRIHYAHLPFVPTALTTYRVYKQVKVLRPLNRFIKDEIFYERIRATPLIPALGRKHCVPAKFDTVLAVEDRAKYEFAGRQGQAGLRVARVRVIFELPPRFDVNTVLLAYVEWFTPLGRVDPITGMHMVTRSTRCLQPNASIIPLHDIISPCHLVAKCGSKIDRTLTSANVLEKAAAFLVNPYFSINEFSLFRLHHIPNP
ncbi:hypothetical protein K474DRAFT_1597442 [Panus rudis PR-1116 ss-1]|nr:hypothetical protein K474DRAFT_1597442 [Panus rudis PR-1116 ss-1]